MSEGGSVPGAPKQTVNFPENAGFVVFEVFETLNTKPARPAIKESEMSWCDGWMPFGPSNIRTLYGIGPNLYTAPSGLTIIAFWFYNLDTTTYAAVLLSDGSLVQVETTMGTITQIMSAGTIQAPNPNQTWTTQWNAKYLIIVSDQTNGYWIWDGASLFTAGSVSPDIMITNAGSNYTSPPTVNFRSTAVSGTGPTFSADITNGSVTAVNVLTPGNGLQPTDFSEIYFTGGGSDNTAFAEAFISPNSGPVTGVTVLQSATNIAATAYVTLDGGGGLGATAALIANAGTLESITVTNGGIGYTSPPTVTFHSLGSASNTPTAQAEISTGSITGFSVLDGGTGYKSPPIVTIIGDGIDATANAVINNAGNVTSIVVSNPGFGYTKALVGLTGGNNAADATISFMPFGIQGSTAEVYVNRVWVGDQRNGYFTAPSSSSDFDPGDGAGAFQSNDSFQRVSYSFFRQTNGFLYLGSDSSLNYIGGVQTSESSAGTTATIFNNLNVDPQIGSPWPSSVQLFSRNIVFANSFGIFVSYGGAVTKISGPLDGIYNTVIQTGGVVQNIYPCSATASLFGIAAYMLLLPIIDPYTGQQVNKLLIWDGKRWFTSNQEIALTYIASQEINSVLTAWGTDGTRLYPLFQQPSTGFQKVLQSKLWANPSYWFKKTTPYIAGILNFNNTIGTVTVTVDNENGTPDGVPINVVSSGEATWINASNVVVSWINVSSVPVIWGAPGLALIPPQLAGQAGVLLGMTVTTNAQDVSILSLALLEENYAYLGG